MHAWLSTYDHNLPLIDVIADPAADPVAVRLAALSLQVGLDSGFIQAEAVADAVSQLWMEEENGVSNAHSEGRRDLARLLESADDYVIGLYRCVGPLPIAAAATLLHAHARIMRDRADMIGMLRAATA
ncbi:MULTISPECIES: hypothetical protein [Sphingobium]|jgi:hypothetical protein|uniref:Uncharacterized protein n=1 Tax=Sphingobium limneticum TaxID=1007511 RepID=A0A5J5HRI1_9SPHN|nr:MULTISPECIES: hypothetical protein [Sphingobium]KAA9011640.1 hypothetical protein F4U94_20235 [Sphingobium limneticum]KAA9012260.1 hypothetical protein F4U96_21440 [Sphingobium limneticum]KAA9024721.1 hypothetical protein F4U95_21555 [Sphingobium limneticum]BBD03372.1 hypothetical protein YGS_C2P1386 [Sphingobium sp. YG1]